MTKDCKTIILLSESYLKHKSLLEDYKKGITHRPYRNIETARYIVEEMERRIKDLCERDYFIIYHEVILGERDFRYLGYMSQATYYRHRKKAYRNLIECLKR